MSTHRHAISPRAAGEAILFADWTTIQLDIVTHDHGLNDEAIPYTSFEHMRGIRS